MDPSSGPVAVFAARLRALREDAGNPTFAAMSRRVHRSPSVLAEAAGGVEFPTWATVEAFVQACDGGGELPAWRQRWQTAQAAVSTAGSAAATVPPATTPPDGPPVSRAVNPVPPTTLSDPAAPAVEPAAAPAAAPLADPRSRAPQPRRARPALPVAAVGLACLALGLAIGVPTGMDLRTTPGAAPTAGPTPMPSVVVVPPPSPLPWQPAGSGCEARTHWVFQYPQPYTGQVYVLLATPVAGPADVTTSITWGAWAWHRSVTVHPGAPAQATGGTLLVFDKLDASARDPLVLVDTSAPTCAAFGTAGGTSVAPLATVDANLGWVDAPPAPTP
ncbi:helix-turn-helix domain-containing protein [Kitasatospora sp. LaBMicrA B282]|uniref:helix-turn-helix domain-containing protein n=1 Tax=Kitasatospora sp. LaBMicrA B282 TaxID=3420949 RepID=UPI003D0CC060